ncbi:CRISPR-associated protein Cst1 [Desulfohalotomaculum tongense]|uniref:type I-B CRISPR-associated protein Cas8b1/Cst1 n=1 Tax=Desulforadius tongensis TaxID=1216062 RepID=UPI00195D0CDB|nr:type I-B CRISPR-associated protein Cas8b1/Cst1 [Desulforadius tongensis]MBM7854980.1 CRISPR-associated protein Cst1 [Desulforadius tongensis]
MSAGKYRSIYHPTGNPFVDAGIYAMTILAGRKNPEELTVADIKEKLPLLAKVYSTDGWARSLYSVFPNRPGITHPRSAKKKEVVLEGLQQLAGRITPGSDTGNCIACGRRDMDEDMRFYRDYIPLTGSGELLNFFPLARPGTDYCSACALAVQFSPLVYYACGKLLLLHTGSRAVMRSWARQCLKNLDNQVATGSFTGVYNERFTNPVNALFNIVENLVLTYEENWLEENPVIRLYHFTNYNQGPELAYYDLPSGVFRFLVLVNQHSDAGQWRQLVRSAFQFSAKEKDEEAASKKVRNLIYQRLLADQSIVAFFINRKERLARSSWVLFSLYLREVRRMNKKRVDTIKRVADQIALTIRQTDRLKRLGQLERVSSYTGLRSVLKLLVKDHLALGAAQPLFTLDEYMEELFPENGMNWRETLDLILFRIYENLHDWLQDKKDILAENEPETAEKI